MDTIDYLVVISIISLIVYKKNYIRCLYLALHLKGPPVLPLLGNVLLINNTQKMVELGTNVYQFYGSFMRIWISIIPFIFIYEPRHLKVILNSKSSKKNIFYKVLHNFIGKGLITNNGLKWKTHRRLIQPYFHMSILENFINIFSESTDDILRDLEGHEHVKITAFINKCVLSILHKGVLGVPLNDQDSPYTKGEVLLAQRVARPWLLLETVFKYTPFAENEMQQKKTLYNYTKNILAKRRKESNKFNPKCLLDMLIEIAENNNHFTDEDIINEAVTFMLAGQDSVGAAVAFSLFFIAKHRTVYQKVVKELDAIYENNNSPTITDLKNMKYLEQCIKESLRLAPSVPIISRVLTEDVILDGHTFPEGMNIFISPFITHRLPHIYPDPLNFNPDRFSQENMEKLHPSAFIPFSMGHRNCIGYKFALLEMKTIISGILHRYNISLLPGQENVEFSYRATLRAKGGIWLRLHSRDKMVTPNGCNNNAENSTTKLIR